MLTRGGDEHTEKALKSNLESPACCTRACMHPLRRERGSRTPRQFGREHARRSGGRCSTRADAVVVLARVDRRVRQGGVLRRGVLQSDIALPKANKIWSPGRYPYSWWWLSFRSVVISSLVTPLRSAAIGGAGSWAQQGLAAVPSCTRTYRSLNLGGLAQCSCGAVHGSLRHKRVAEFDGKTLLFWGNKK